MPPDDIEINGQESPFTFCKNPLSPKEVTAFVFKQLICVNALQIGVFSYATF